MNIVVLGAGAIGSLFGALLSKKNNVILIGRTSHVNAIRKNGLSIGGKTQLNVKISAKDSINSIPFSVDLLIVTVKSYDTKSAIDQAKQIIHDKTVVLSLQNGLDNIKAIEHVVERRQIIAGVTTHGAFFSKPGCIKHTGVGKTVLGELDGESSERIKNIENIFNLAEIGTVVSKNIIKDMWVKAVINSSINPITAFFGCSNGYLLENPLLEKIVEKICEESTNVANAYGIKLSYSDMVQRTKEVIRKTSENYSSMLQSVQKGKTTEIDSINGVLIDIGRTYNVDVSLNEILVSLIKNLFNNSFFV
ncbi:MAG: 2-dehydropantoate 2-reductase [Thermoplasmatales archaeon]|nr:2-dehydropantoate 2-reductase [Thermoplasmatales archaeon]